MAEASAHGGGKRPWRRQAPMAEASAHGGGKRPWRRQAPMAEASAHGGGKRPWRRQAPMAEASAHGGGKRRHYYTRRARRLYIVVAALASAMPALIFRQRLCAIAFKSSSKPRKRSQLPVSPVTTTSTCLICSIRFAPLNCIATFNSAITVSTSSHTFS